MYQRRWRGSAKIPWMIVTMIVMCTWRTTPAQPDDVAIKPLLKKNVTIQGVTYLATIITRSRMAERTTDDGGVRETALRETLLSISPSNRDSEDRIIWWRLVPEAGLGVMTGDPVFDACIYECGDKTLLLLVIANTYYYGYSIIVIDTAHKDASVPADWRSEGDALPSDDKRLSRHKSKSELLVISSRSTNKSDRYGTKSIHISVEGDTISVNRISKSGKAIAESVSFTQAERARVLAPR